MEGSVPYRFSAYTVFGEHDNRKMDEDKLKKARVFLIL